MRAGLSRRLIPLALIVLCGLTACGRSLRHTATTMAPASATPIATDLDAIFTSPVSHYTIRYNHTWTANEVFTANHWLDFFILPGATFAVTVDRAKSGTQLDSLFQATMEQYENAHIQGLQRSGTVNIGGGQGEMLHATTYVADDGSTLYSPDGSDQRPRNLYQAFYVAGNTSYTFSIAWPASDHTDYLSLFRSILRTFTLAGTT